MPTLNFWLEALCLLVAMVVVGAALTAVLSAEDRAMDFIDFLFLAFVGATCLSIVLMAVFMPAFVFSWVAASIKKDRD